VFDIIWLDSKKSLLLRFKNFKDGTSRFSDKENQADSGTQNAQPLPDENNTYPDQKTQDGDGYR